MSSLADTPRRLAELVQDIKAHGFDHIDSYAWRDLDDPDAGGSEVHADHVLSLICKAGLSVSHRTSCKNSSREFERNGYHVLQRGSRYGIFPRVILRNIFGRRCDTSIVVEIWNGVPWFARLWARGPRVTVMHHIHEDMWRDSLPRILAPLGRILEVRIAPAFYKDAPLITLANSTRDELIRRGFHPDKVHVAHPGIDKQFFAIQPNGHDRLKSPLLVAVGRLTPVKRFDLLITTFDQLHRAHPNTRLLIIGEGPEDHYLKKLIQDRGLSSSVTLAGRVERDELVAAYRDAALLVSMSHSEGWGMTITEAAASGTPCVVTDNIGHRGAVVSGRTGILVADDTQFAQTITDVLGDPTRWAEMATASFAHSQTFSWDTCAEKILRVVDHEVRRHSAEA